MAIVVLRQEAIDDLNEHRQTQAKEHRIAHPIAQIATNVESDI